MTHVSNLMKKIPRALTWVGRTIKEGRQRSANMEIARMLQETEYRNESVYTVYAALNRQDLRSISRYPS